MTRIELVAALIADLALGDPRAVPHPVVAMGAAIAYVERRTLRRRRSARIERIAGAALTCWLVGTSIAAARLVRSAGPVPTIVLAASTLAMRSLDDAVRAVEAPLAADDLDAARAALGRIVGRDVRALDARGIAAAAIESLAESLGDGVATPLFALAVFGPAGALAFKAISTLDSMIGHREQPHTWFGAFAARADDVANLLPARLTGLALAACAGVGGGSPQRALRAMLADARKHASPNAGFPEAAMAGALDVRLGGPARYDGMLHDRAVLGTGPEPHAADLRRALRIARAAYALLAFAALALARR
jgi:adenosylcobinamide-phosphate synthase